MSIISAFDKAFKYAIANPVNSLSTGAMNWKFVEGDVRIALCGQGFDSKLIRETMIEEFEWAMDEELEYQFEMQEMAAA